MITCKEAAQLISQSLDRRLPLGRRIALWSHLLMCRVCPRFLRQVRFLRTAAARRETAIESMESSGLSPEARGRIKRTLTGPSDRQNSV